MLRQAVETACWPTEAVSDGKRRDRAGRGLVAEEPDADLGSDRRQPRHLPDRTRLTSRHSSSTARIVWLGADLVGRDVPLLFPRAFGVIAVDHLPNDGVGPVVLQGSIEQVPSTRTDVLEDFLGRRLATVDRRDLISSGAIRQDPVLDGAPPTQGSCSRRSSCQRPTQGDWSLQERTLGPASSRPASPR